MKRVLIISGLSSNTKATSYAKHFSQAIDDYQFTDLNFDQLTIEVSPHKFEVSDGRNGQTLNQYDLVFIREYKGFF